MTNKQKGIVITLNHNCNIQYKYKIIVYDVTIPPSSKVKQHFINKKALRDSH